MKKLIIQLSLSFLACASSYGAVTLNAATVINYQDENGGALAGDVLGVLVLDTAGDGFSAITTSDTLTLDSLLSDGNDLILSIVESNAGFPAAGIAPSIEGAPGGLRVELENGVTTGDQFAVYWFPDLDLTTSAFSVDDVYGIATDEITWILPGDGGTSNTDAVASPGAAIFRVTEVIPEPSSTTLLGLGGLALLARRRRA